MNITGKCINKNCSEVQKEKAISITILHGHGELCGACGMKLQITKTVDTSSHGPGPKGRSRRRTPSKRR
jgi:hypothetical protein